MNALDHFERWAAAARREQPPAIDVSATVLRAVEPTLVRETVDRPLLICSGLSAVAAAAAAVVIVQAWNVVEPVVYLFDSLTMVWQ